MKFVEPKVVDSLSENGLLLAQDGDDVVKIPANKLIVGDNGDGDEPSYIFYIDAQEVDDGNYDGNVEFGNEVLMAFMKNIPIYVNSMGMNNAYFSSPPISYVSRQEFHSSVSYYYLDIYYFGQMGSTKGIKSLTLQCNPDLLEQS